MKRQSIFIAMCLFFIMAAQSQVVLHTSENFEDGLPAGWTFSSNNVSVEENETIAINGKKFVRVKHASGVEYLQSPQITVGAGQSVRLEFNHIPMTKCNVRVQLVVDGNPTPMSLSGSNVYDNKYRPGINGATGATFNDGTYYPGKDITKVTSINQLMWQHEVYYLTSKLGDNVTFSIRFQMPTGNDNGYGWLIDDFKIYTAPASDGILPRLEQIVTCPNMKNYPYCNDANIEFKISDADGGLTTTEDSLYVAYYTPHNPALTYVKLQKTATGNYSAQIPYMGIDSTVYWKAVITDANGNKTNYPYTGNFYEFKYVRPYTGDEPVKQNATGSESLIFATDYAKVSNQIRYSAQELWDAGYSAGIIGGFYLNIKTRPSNVPTLQNFKIYIGSISSDYKFDEDDNSQYSDLVNVVNQVEFIVPDLGWQYIPFDNNSVFVWDGQSDIIIKTCFDGTKVGGATKVQSYSSGSDKQYQTRRLLQDATTSIVACSGNFNTDSKFLISSKPNIRFNFINECYFSTDAGIRKDTLLLPNPAKDCQGNLRQTYVCQKGVAATLKVMLRNDGTTPITKVKVKWMTDDDILTLDSSLWTGTMKPLSADKIPQDTAVVFTATTKFLPSAGVHELKIWTEMADNTTIDWNYANDTAVFKLFVTDGSMSGNYAVGGTIAGIASGRTFKSFEDAFIMLINSGVGGACNFRINSNNSDTVYLDNIDFPSCIQGLSESNTITFSNEDLLHEVVFEPKANLPYIFDLSDIKYFNFKNIAFSVNPSLSELNVNQFDIIKMNDNSSHIKFDSCRFLSYQHTAKYYDRIASAVNIGKASDISINNCTFDLPARYVVKGEGLSSSSPVKNINISNSVFSIISDSKQNMVENAVNINFAKDISITKNIFTTSQEDSYYENLTSVYYSVLLSNTENAMVTKNKFELLSLSAVSFSSVNNSMVANNMFSLDNINTNAVNYNAYGLYVQSGKNNYVVYNNVYTRSMKLSSKKTYGFNLGSASESSGNIVKNNILVSEGYGYAVALRSVNNDFALSRNMYYKKPTINNIPLFSYNGATNTDIETWKTQTGETNAFYEEDPFFQSWNNLYSTNITLCESGDWVNGVEDDYFDSDRPKATEKRPCIGNREFNPPPNNIYVLATGLADYDMTSANTYAECDLSYEKIFVEFKNVSSNTIPANTVKFNYSVNGNVSVAATFPNEVKPDEVYHFEFPQTYDFSALSGNMSFDLKAFSVLDIDTVKSNDTASANIISYYRLPALADQNIDVKYGNSVQIDVTSLCPNDSVYWFYTPASTDYFHKGHSFQTDLLYSDSTIYFARREETPVIRITEIQYSKDASKVGLTPNIPNYVTANNAYEISNCGSLDVDMSGYQFVYYSGSNITKSYATYTFPNGYVLKANSAVVLVASNSVTVGDDVAISVDATKFKVATTAKGGFAVVNASGKYIDALTVNGAAFANSMNVPATVWQSTDEPVTIVAASAGIIRNDVKSTTSLGWIAADEFNTMSIGRYNEDLTDSTENLCLGYLTPYNIHITDVPNYDPGVSVVYLDTVSSLPYNANNPFYACGLSESEIKINLTNTGLKDLESIPVVCLIYDNGVQIDSFTAEYTNTLKQFESAEFTFASKLDLTANNNDRNIVIKVYTSRDDDVVHNNDTAYFYILSAHTPLPPVAADVTADYGTQALLTANSDYVVIWYDAIDSQEELARGSQYETPVLYEDKTYYVETLLQKQYAGAIGKDSALVTTSNPSPSPLNAKTKNIKEQYLLSADSLSAYGYSEGDIKGFAVKISSITPPSKKTSVNYTDYNVKIGPTEQTSLSAWETGLTLVYSGGFELASTEKGWKFINFTEPYYWDGVSDLVLEVCFSVEQTATVTTYTKTTQQSSTLSYKNGTSSVCDYTATYTSYSKIPYLQLDMDVFGCKSSRTPVNVTLENVPYCDAGLVAVVSPEDRNVVSGEEVPIAVELKNFGINDLSSAVIKWKVNSVEQPQVSWTAETALQKNETAIVSLGNYVFSAGIAVIEAEVVVDCGDNMHGNDTVSKDIAACIGNATSVTHLTISEQGGDYTSLSDALSEIEVSGICGPIELTVAEGTYDERIKISDIQGLSSDNTITIKSANGKNVVFTYTGSVDDETNGKYLLDMRNVSDIYFSDIKFEADSSFDALVNMKNNSDIKFNNITLSVNSSNNPATVLVNMQGNNNGISFVADTFINGNTSILTANSETMSSDILIDSCVFLNFRATGVDINGYDNVVFAHNKVRASSNDFVADALKFSNIGGVSKIESNEVILTEGNNKARSAFVIHRASCEDMNPLLVANNAISIIGSSKVKAYGIDLDSSNFVNLYYNTILLRVSTSNTNTRGMFIGKSNTNVVVRNNNLDNQCGGYAYYVESPATQVIVSDNNNYTTNGTKLTYWTKDCSTIEALQTTNKFDVNSVSAANKFKSDTNLEFLYPTDIVYAAEPVEGVDYDIIGNTRPVTPKPTIGAYEYQFSSYDAGVIAVYSPVSKTSYIEGDPIDIELTVRNFGKNTVSRMDIYAVMKGHKGDNVNMQTIHEAYNGNLSSLDTLKYTFNQKFTAQLNTPSSDSVYVQLYTVLNGDTAHYNDTMSLFIKVVPGKDLNCVATKNQDANVKCGIDMRNQEIAVSIKNIGNKAVSSSDVINVTYEITGQNGNLKAKQTEQIVFPFTYVNSSGNTVTLNDLQPNATLQYYTFNKKVNLEPTGSNDTTWSIRTYVHVTGDNNPSNDTSGYVTYTALVSPKKPVAQNASVYYATSATVGATQADELPIRWYHDTTDVNPFYKPSKYDESTTLDVAGPLYKDTLFYTRVYSNGNVSCPSDFVPVKVTIRPRCTSDVVALEITEPPAQPEKGYIFMSEDTVKVKLTNFGTQTQTGFNIVCSVKPTVPSDAEPQLFRETCTASIMTDDTVIYAFNRLFDFSADSTTYELRVWTENNKDCTHVNDTTDVIKILPLPWLENDATLVSNAESIDITRVQFGTIDNVSAALSDRYTDYTQSVSPAELFKGLEDSLLLTVEPSSDMKIDGDTELSGWIKVWIDWNRDGVLDSVSELVYSEAAKIGDINRAAVKVPDDARNGYTLMRIIVSQDDEEHTFGPNPGNGTYPVILKGEIEDYKLHVSPLKNVNAELVRFVSPQRQDTVTESKLVVRLRNAGKTDLTSADITWIYDTDTNIYNWEGNLSSSGIEDVELADVNLNLGHNHFKAYVTVRNDEYLLNDTVVLDNYIYPIYTVPYIVDFDDSEVTNNDFYAYEADPRKPSNLWQMGTPDANGNNVIKSAYSRPKCWKTNISGQYTMNNTSILYTPIFNIDDNNPKPDTLSFMMRRDMGPGASMVVEYLNYKGLWTVLGKVNDPHGTNWYDSEDGFTKTNVAWERSSYSLEAINGELGKRIQFRFIFTSQDGRIMDGVAIDDFSLDRALRDLDAGVTAIVLTPDELPSYGQYFYPKVTVHNYGKKDITSFKVCYIAEDMHIPQCEDVLRTVPVGGNVDYTFKNGRYLDVSMPDPFSITAYTRLNPDDLYTDNDTAFAHFVISPLLVDVGLLDITEPLTKIASNDNVSVSVKVKNYGLQPVDSLPVYYTAGGSEVVEEIIHFVPELNNGDEYIYTFRTPYRTSFGTVNLKSWVGLAEDVYHDNDTLYKRLQAGNDMIDIEAKYITLDDANAGELGLQLAFMNRSSKVAKNISVGYYLNGDPTTKVEELYRGGDILTASTVAYHTFSRKISKNMYQSVCAYVRYNGDENTSNDTTCSVYLGYRDLQADSIYVEQNVNSECKVQLTAHHVGTLAGKGTVRACYVLNGDYSHTVRQDFQLEYDNPDGRQIQLTFNKGVQRNDESKYNIVAWIEYSGDNNRKNDTTKVVKVQTFVGLDDELEASEDFVVKQNKPNPFSEQTVVEISVPQSDVVYLDVFDNRGRNVYSFSNNYSQGNHSLTLPLESLSEGTYYYTVRYRNRKITKKMVKID